MLFQFKSSENGGLRPPADVEELIRYPLHFQLALDMRNFIVFVFWYVVHFFLIGALAGFWVHLDSSTLTV